MTEFKLNIGDPTSKKTKKHEVKDEEAEIFLGKKIGDKVAGTTFGFEGYEFEITGGSDYTGVPMRKDVIGTARKRILIVSGTGIRKNRKGRRVRKTMAGNTIYEKTAQINLKVTKSGKTPLFEEEKPTEESETNKEDTTDADNKEEQTQKEEPKENKA